MKRFMISMLCFLALVPHFFAQETDNGVYEEKDKILAVVPGLRLSILGLEPVVAVDVYNFEAEAGIALSSGLAGETFGVAPSISVGYNTNPFDRGGFAVFGLEYMYLSPTYTNAYLSTFASDDADLSKVGIHSLSLFYKGGVSFNNVFGLLWRVRLPLVIGGSAEGESFNLNVTNWAGFGANVLIGVCTFSIGVKFSI